jgi:hypothetical protein
VLGTKALLNALTRALACSSHGGGIGAAETVHAMKDQAREGL